MSTPQSERTMRAQIAAHQSWANTTDRSARTANARKAMLDKFEREVDPEGVLTPAERAVRAEHARKAYYTRLALKSAQSRRKAAEAWAAIPVLESAATEDGNR
ncbi:uncharacterized protein YbaA (DUF1428 family) [Rhodococcus sp. PvR044]|uniref:hypothetical protein n=1 Tax=Rhodococcus sp. PvR044 TaxID=3156402 RepID=UPI00339B6FD7